MTTLTDQLAEALRRLERNTLAYISRKPVRDMDEMLCECKSILARYDAQKVSKGVVEVCPDCDIADCKHIRERRSAAPTNPQEVEAVAEALMDDDYDGKASQQELARPYYKNLAMAAIAALDKYRMEHE